MANAVTQIQSTQVRTLSSLQHDRFLADANWDLVAEYTSIEDPYKVVIINCKMKKIKNACNSFK